MDVAENLASGSNFTHNASTSYRLFNEKREERVEDVRQLDASTI